MTPYIVQLHQAIAAKPQSIPQIADHLGWPKNRVRGLLRQLQKQNLIRPVGHAPARGYIYGLVQ